MRIWRAPSSAALTSGTCFSGGSLSGFTYFAASAFRAQRRIVEQRIGQRLQPGLAGDLRLGAALLLVGQIEVFEALLGVGILDVGAQLGRQLALFVDAGEDRRTALLQFAQVAQALFEVAQLGVVEIVGDFLAVAGDEGHGGAFVEQLDSGDDLGGTNAEFLGDAMFDGRQHAF